MRNCIRPNSLKEKILSIPDFDIRLQVLVKHIEPLHPIQPQAPKQSPIIEDKKVKSAQELKAENRTNEYTELHKNLLKEVNIKK